MTENVTIIDMGKLIGKYLREVGVLPEYALSKTDEEIGKLVFESCPGGDLGDFFDFYYNARCYYKMDTPEPKDPYPGSIKIIDGVMSAYTGKNWVTLNGPPVTV